MQSALPIESESRTYRLTPPGRLDLRAGASARLYVGSLVVPAPEGDFALEQDGTVYRLRCEGEVEQTLRYVRRRAQRGAHRHSPRYFYPVLVLAIESMKGGA